MVSARIHSVSTLELSRPGCPGNKRAGGVCRCQALNTNLSASRKVAWQSLLFLLPVSYTYSSGFPLEASPKASGDGTALVE